MAQNKTDCKWITCDDMFHFNTCKLKSIERDFLYESFKELGLKFPDVAWKMSDGCVFSERCFTQKNKDADEDDCHVDGEGFTQKEKTIVGMCKDKYKNKDLVLANYTSLVEMSMSEIERKISELKSVAEEMKKERKNTLDVIGLSD